MEALKEKDAPALAGLEGRCFSTAWNADQYRELLRATERAWRDVRAGRGALPRFAALGLKRTSGHGPHLVAYVTFGLHEAAREAEIYNIAVAPECRRQGLARVLLGRCLRDLAGLGFARLVLEVRESNRAALALYASAGFSRCGRRARYYADTGEDALVLEKALEKAPDNAETIPDPRV